MREFITNEFFILDRHSEIIGAFDSIEQPKKAIEVLKEAARLAHEQNDIERCQALLHCESCVKTNYLWFGVATSESAVWGRG